LLHLCWSSSLECHDFISGEFLCARVTGIVVDSRRDDIPAVHVVLFATLLFQMLQIWIDHTNGGRRCGLSEGVGVECRGTTQTKFGRNHQSHVDRCATVTGFDNLSACSLVQLLANWFGVVLFVETIVSEKYIHTIMTIA
jgi:hypothetical protein